MKKLYLVGIGTGDPEHLTLQALHALEKAQVFFLLEKESERNEALVKLREELLERHLPAGSYRIRRVQIPERRRGGKELALYQERVEAWRRRKAELLAEAIRQELADGEVGAILIWGDPSLYDGHIEVLEDIRREGWAELDYEVIPGITSMQVLAAKHRIPLNLVGESIHVTTGRRLKELAPAEVRNEVVLLDNQLAYRSFEDADLDIYWGAYLGTSEEVLISGELGKVAGEIVRTRTEARRRNGWIMETYILRARGAPEEP